MNNHSIEAQRQRLLHWLQQRLCTTMEARHELDILGVAPRVHELRRLGYNIKTLWAKDQNPGGKKHRVAQYVLMSGKWQGGSHE